MNALELTTQVEYKVTSTGNVANYAQPTQNSTGYFSQVGSQIIQNNLVVKAIIKVNAYSAEGTGNMMFSDFTA